MEEFNYKQVTANMKALRVRKGMTQEDVAEILGVTRQTMRSYENNPRTLDLCKIIALAKIYDVPPRAFFMD